jgi:uncharacterized membrane protein
MVVRAVITLLCGVGLYASLFMLAKSRKAERGELLEPSVVELPRARLYGGVQNSLLGSLYYPAFGLAIWWVRSPIGMVVLLVVVLLAAITSVVLGYSLLFVTRRECSYCWTGHIVNLTLLVLYCWLFWYYRPLWSGRLKRRNHRRRGAGS